MRFLLTTFCTIFLVSQQLVAQWFVGGGFAQNFKNMPTLNTIVQKFNDNESHTLGKFNNMSGYHFGIGNYSTFMFMELGMGNMIRVQKSHNPTQLKENALITTNFTSVSMLMGLRPIPNQYFVVGVGTHFGACRIRYSFGGNFQTPVLTYTIAPEFFVDYAFKVRFLLKKESRDKMYYMIRIHPYYQLQFPLDVTKVEKQLNGNTLIKGKELQDNWSNFGIRIGLYVPFGALPEKIEPRPKRDPNQPRLTRKQIREKVKMQ